MAKYAEMTVKEYMTELAAGTPIPGGGGAAAMSGALGAALASMTANMTIGREKYAANEPELKELLALMERARVRLLDLVDEDAIAFNKLITGFKMPKKTEAEIEARKKVIRSAAKESAEVPLNVSRLMVEILGVAARLVVIGNPNVITDAACSVLFARAAMRCAAYNVKINLPLTKDPAYIKAAEDELRILRRDAIRFEHQAMDVVEKVLG